MTDSQRQSFRAVDALIGLAVALLYIACAKLGLALAVHAAQVSAVWPPSGFALAAIVLFGRRAIPGILIGAFVSNATASEPLWVAAGIAAGNTLEAMAGAAILRRLQFDAALARLRDVMALLAAVALSPTVAATIGTLFLIAGRVHSLSDMPELWGVWWLGDALGGLIVAPLLLLWSRAGRLDRQRGFLEPALMLAAMLVVVSAVFSQPFAVAYLVYPVLIWAALRLGPTYTTTAALLANAIAVAGTLAGRGPFANAGPEHGLVLVQIFMAVGATTALILGSVAAHTRRTNERAELSEQRLRMAMAGARVGVWDWNIATNELVWSEGLEPLHGLAPGSFAGTYDAYRRTIHPDDLERVEALIARSLETREPYEAEFRLIGSDRVQRWTSARGLVVADAAGRAARMVGVGIDVTHLKRLEEELRLQHRRKDEFLAMLGHELRNPLAAIVHAIEALASPDAVESGEARKIIRRQANNLSRLVDDLLDVSRITSGKIHLERRTVAISEIVNGAADMWRHLVERKRQRLTIDVPPLWVDGDSMRLTQLMANLIHNAAKFTPEGGTIAITASEEDGSAVVSVRDDGLGMPSDFLADAFELFVQGPRSLDRQSGGLGLGLTLVRRLAELHGGSVEAKSAGANRGSEIIVRLPLVDAPLAVELPAPVPASPPAPPRARRVLIVEDNDDARTMLEFLLRRDGHDVRSAADGLSALREAESFAPEVVLLDVGLPEMDGYAVARRLRSSPRTSEALLVALTGYGQAEDREKTRAAGFDHHLLKPAEPARVLELMRATRAAH